MGVDNPSNYKRAIPDFAANPKLTGGEQPFVRGPGFQREQDSNIGQSLMAMGNSLAGVVATKRQEEDQKRAAEDRMTTALEQSTMASKWLMQYQQLQKDLPTATKGMAPAEAEKYGMEQYSKMHQGFMQTEVNKVNKNAPQVAAYLETLKANKEPVHQEFMFNTVSSQSTMRVLESEDALYQTTLQAVGDTKSDPFTHLNQWMTAHGNLAAGQDWSSIPQDQQMKLAKAYQEKTSNLLEHTVLSRLYSADDTGRIDITSVEKANTLLNDPRTKAMLDPEAYLKLQEKISDQIVQYDKTVAGQRDDQVKADYSSVVDAFKNGTATSEHEQWFLRNKAYLTPLQQSTLGVMVTNRVPAKDFTDKYVAASPAERARMEKEAQTNLSPSSGDVTEVKLGLPLNLPLSAYNAPHHAGSKNTHAVDLKVPAGTPIKASYSGEVVKTGYDQYNGNFIHIQYSIGSDTYTAKYLHMKDAPKFRKGELVNGSQVLGNVGNTGKSNGDHLHFQVEKNGKPIKATEFLTGKYEGVDTGAEAKREFWKTVISSAKEKAKEFEKNPRLALSNTMPNASASVVTRAILDRGLTNILDEAQQDEFIRMSEEAITGGDPKALPQVIQKLAEDVGPEYLETAIVQLSKNGTAGPLALKSLAAATDISRGVGTTSHASLAALAMDGKTQEVLEDRHGKDLKSVVNLNPDLQVLVTSRLGNPSLHQNAVGASMEQVYKTVLLIKQSNPGLTNEQAVQSYLKQYHSNSYIATTPYGKVVLPKPFADKLQQSWGHPPEAVVMAEARARLGDMNWLSKNVLWGAGQTDSIKRNIAKNAKLRIAPDGKSLEVFSQTSKGEVVWSHRSGRPLRIPLAQLLEQKTRSAVDLLNPPSFSMGGL